MKRIAIAVCVVVLVFSVASIAQTPAKPEKSQMCLIRDVTLRPSMAAQFTDAVKAYKEFCVKHKSQSSWDLYMSDDYHCFIIYPVAGFAEVENLYREEETFSTTFSTEFQAVSNKFKGTFDSSRDFIATYEPDLSFIPEKPRGEGDFVCVDYWYILPGYEQEFVSLCKEFWAIARTKKIVDCWYFLAGGLGSDQPVYMFVNHEKGPAEFWSHNADMWNSLGKDASELQAKMIKLLRKREATFEWYQAELSYSPKK
jgi:hypothetical protein